MRRINNRQTSNRTRVPLSRLGLWAVLCLILAAIPGQALACNMIHGQILNAFRYRHITRAPFFVNLAIIVLVESLLLRLFMRRNSYGKALLRSAGINVASCIAIALFFAVIGNPFFSGHRWNVSTYKSLLGQYIIPQLWILPLTLATELPLLRYMARRAKYSWKRLLPALVLANVFSTFVVCHTEPQLLNVWYEHLRRADAKLLSQWHDVELLQEAGGRIFTLSEEQLDDDGYSGTRYGGLTVDGKVMPSGPLGYRLRYFDCADGEWHAVTNSPRISPMVWSLTTNRLAFVEDGEIRVVSFPGMQPVSTIAPTNHQALTPNSLALSQDGTQLAMSYAESAIVRKASISASRMFFRNEILVFETDSGVLLRRCPRWALPGPLFWSPDADSVLFLSAQDESELERDVVELELVPERRSDVRHFGVDPKLKQDLLALDVDSGGVQLFRKAIQPVSQSGDFLIWAKHSRILRPRLGLLDLRAGEQRSITIKGLGGWNRLMQLSPDGRFLCTESRLAWVTCHAIIDLESPDRRHVISERPLIVRPIHSMPFVWLPD